MEAFSVLRRAVRHERGAREAGRLEMLERVKDSLSGLAPRYDLDEVWLFGSLLKPGRFRADSDVDVAVAGLGARYWSFAAELSELLEREVDVADLDTCHFAYRIRRDGIRWTPRR